MEDTVSRFYHSKPGQKCPVFRCHSKNNFGSLYTIQIADLAFNKITDGKYNQFTFNFVDSVGQPIIFQDPNMLILLVIKNKSELLY